MKKLNTMLIGIIFSAFSQASPLGGVQGGDSSVSVFSNLQRVIAQWATGRDWDATKRRAAKKQAEMRARAEREYAHRHMRSKYK
jgi:hypothetical protein